MIAANSVARPSASGRSRLSITCPVIAASATIAKATTNSTGEARCSDSHADTEPSSASRMKVRNPAIVR